ncbi:MAG TPA: peptidylprolyl isomerase [Acidimicrobiales bacterium]|nr:peptidylprolyl isomerase [Acidimicrobiales bacterium]
MAQLVVLALAVAVLAACGSAAPYAAKVNGERISERELDRELDALLANEAYLRQVDQALAEGQRRALGDGNGTLDSAFVADQLFRRIALRLVGQEVQRRNLEVTEEDTRRTREELARSYSQDEATSRRLFNGFPRQYREELVEDFAAVAALERELRGAEVGAEEIQRRFERQPGEFDVTCVRHILIEDEAKAAQVQARLAAGEDFAAVARSESRDPGSASEGGDLGCLSGADLGSFDADFVRGLQDLPTGQVSEPVRTRFGFHLVQVTERRSKSLEEATAEIRDLLESEREGRFIEFIRGELARADIDVNPRYGRFVTSPRPQLVPPGAAEEESPEQPEASTGR